MSNNFVSMKAISLMQPWASLVRDGRKQIETRSWKTLYRGSLAIHASNTLDKEACKQFKYDWKVIPRGRILCVANLIDCVQFPNPKAPPDPYGDFTAGRWGWILRDIKPLQDPVPQKGRLGLWPITLRVE